MTIRVLRRFRLHTDDAKIAATHFARAKNLVMHKANFAPSAELVQRANEYHCTRGTVNHIREVYVMFR